ncbi:hypothetical protein BO70DRAFT_95987 [Aspergillus heteromorphus CBS 117.55]|uniref:Uncharacterized protein n=1 Tax=Aspergillus heteromorphus CBS 117.55 TaxID=1448321 RepID=A0A317VN92_9EURO|nr:uncharacterized protein BO70DRAFT_95987 [Aspergillus heteromorphus CBS 117.55]PWY75395.1 hypothetical protein BO70DRAFT_95987 [Aspergillus heteromorphus CBS 117.55]
MTLPPRYYVPFLHLQLAAAASEVGPIDQAMSILKIPSYQGRVACLCVCRLVTERAPRRSRRSKIKGADLSSFLVFFFP